jgi:hypothetical protein
LAGAEWFGRLTAVRLFGFEQLGDAGLVRLLAARPLPNLQDATLHNCGLTGAGVPALAGPGLAGLIQLTLAGTRFWDEAALPALAAGPQRYLSLDLSDARMRTRTAAVFFNGRAVRSLRRLSLPGGFLDSAAVAALAGSPLPAVLRVLRLSCDHSARPAVWPLLDGPPWPHLARLHLDGLLSGEALLALVESPNFSRVVSLSAGCCDPGAVFLRKLARSPALARLRELDLGAGITPSVAQALADSPHLDGIDRLLLSRGRGDLTGCERLVSRFGSRVQIRGYNA